MMILYMPMDFVCTCRNIQRRFIAILLKDCFPCCDVNDNLLIPINSMQQDSLVLHVTENVAMNCEHNCDTDYYW